MPLVNAFGAIALDASVKETHADHIGSSSDIGEYIRPLPSTTDRIGFAKVIANNVDTSWGTLVKTGTGMTVNQAAGNLVITSGTTAGSETIIRSAATYTGSLRLKFKATLSQRILQNNFFIELVDVIGDGLAIVINSATSVTVTYGSAVFDATNIGQAMYLGNYTGTGTFVPGRYVIASVAGNAVTYTVAGFAAGSGTCSVFGWNYYHMLYESTVATNMKWDSQRRGWALGDTIATVNSTATGHIVMMAASDNQATLYDSAASSTLTVRNYRNENVPDDYPLKLQIRAANGASAPATTTTFTVGYVSVSTFAPLDTVVQDLHATTGMSPQLTNAVITNSPAVTITSGTVTTVSSVSSAIPQVGTNYFVESTAAALAAAIKGSAGNLFEITIGNPTATACYVKLYSKATAPAPASDTPLTTIPVPANSFVNYNFGTLGKRFAIGISIGATALAAKTDTTVLAAGVQISATYN
jgi:hypothetical protein